MDFSSGFSSSLQVIAALVIFIAGYLALILGAIMFMVVAELISERASVSQAYAVKSALAESCTLSASRSQQRGAKVAAVAATHISTLENG